MWLLKLFYSLFFTGCPKTLTSQCRLAIRKHLIQVNKIQSLDSLEIPPRLIDYLKHNPMNSALVYWQNRVHSTVPLLKDRLIHSHTDWADIRGSETDRRSGLMTWTHSYAISQTDRYTANNPGLHKWSMLNVLIN